MLDVIEHLPESEINNIISEIAKNTNSGGFLFGETPNKKSLNIYLFKNKDPVVCPPSHLIYFNKNSLDTILKRHGFKKILLFTKGLSTNSFFRPEKFTPSFVEMPRNIIQKIISKLIKIIFMIFSLPAALCGSGYQIIFLYQYCEDTRNIETDIS